ncbi:hypothetical protein CJ030_MR5G001025 [Morella rubra]|uniref:Uncharacterized protein n=1 Tax=Morella rubra TaxID=262757 RepID=A0A6A1VI86_9ROSI|nr:hypothetical protein CJ030_MR5G001025 [Morella rubra]
MTITKQGHKPQVGIGWLHRKMMLKGSGGSKEPKCGTTIWPPAMAMQGRVHGGFIPKGIGCLLEWFGSTTTRTLDIVANGGAHERWVLYDPRGSMEPNDITTPQGGVMKVAKAVTATLGIPYDKLVPDDPGGSLEPFKVTTLQGSRMAVAAHGRAYDKLVLEELGRSIEPIDVTTLLGGRAAIATSDKNCHIG